MTAQAATYAARIRANVDRFYADDDYRRFSARQRALWGAIQAAGLLDEVSDILRQDGAVRRDGRA